MGRPLRTISPVDETFVFGSFRLISAQRELFEDEKPLRLGSRALDILVTLVQSAGDTIHKDQSEFDTRAADLPRPSGPAVWVADRVACRGDMAAIKIRYLEHNRAQRNLPIA